MIKCNVFILSGLTTNMSYLLFVFSIIAISCSKEEELFYNKEHTVIVYMIANNDLYKNALDDLNEMESAWNYNYNGNIVVVIEPKSSKNEIYVMEIEKDNDLQNIKSRTIQLYDDMHATNSDDMKAILLDVVNQYPSKRYSLILWSHATGWLPPNTILTYTRGVTVPTKPRSFGESNNLQIDIKELSNSIPANVFDLIIFDACYMGSIEVVYEMKDKANYIIASPTEILEQGFPYESIIGLLFSKENNIGLIAKSYIDFYKSLEGAYCSATIGVIKTSQLQALAEQTKALIYNAKNPHTIINHISEIQPYDRFKDNIFYDFKEAMRVIGEEGYFSDLFFEQFEKTIIYSDNTEWFFGDFEIKYFSGISCYVPNKNNVDINSYYTSLSWYKDSGFDVIINSMYGIN